MFISKAQLEAIRMINKDDRRPNTNALHITENEVVATDGHRMIVVEHGKVPKLDADFETGAEPKLPGTLTRESVESVLRSWPKCKKSEKQDHHDWAWIGESKIHVIDNRGRAVQYPAEWTGLSYPKWQQVTPNEREMANGVAVDIRYLSDASYLTFRDDMKIPALDLRIRDPYSPVLCLGQNKQGQACSYTIMPVRLEVEYSRIKTTQHYIKAFEQADLTVEDVVKDLAPISDDDTVTLHDKVYFKSQVDEAFKALKNKT